MLRIFGKKESDILDLPEEYFDSETKDEFFRRYFDKRRPVLIKRGAKEWPLMKKWSKQYIVSIAGNEVCTVVSDSRPASSQQQETLKRYFKEHRNKSTLTLQKYDREYAPKYLEDVPIPSPFFSNETIHRFFFYHSIENAGTLPHRHGDAFNILVSGKKKWVFYDASPLHSKKGFDKMNEFHQSYPPGSHACDWFANEVNKLASALRRTQVYQCIQEPGDIVYIPRDYAHAVLNLDEVLGVVFECKGK